MTKKINLEESDKRILNFLGDTAQNLNLGEIESVERISSMFYPWRIKFLVDTSTGKFLFKFYDEGLNNYPFSFINFLNSKDFPAQKLVNKNPAIDPRGVPVLVYSFLEGRIKPDMTEEDLKRASQLVAKLHSESDNFHERAPFSDSGFTHGDFKAQNSIFHDNDPYLIDLDKMKRRAYVSDIAYFVFHNALSDLYHGYGRDEVLVLSRILIEEYEKIRRLNKSELSEFVLKKGEAFRRIIEERIKVLKPSIKDELRNKKSLINLVYEVLS